MWVPPRSPPPRRSGSVSTGGWTGARGGARGLISGGKPGPRARKPHEAPQTPCLPPLPPPEAGRPRPPPSPLRPPSCKRVGGRAVFLLAATRSPGEHPARMGAGLFFAGIWGPVGHPGPPAPPPWRPPRTKSWASISHTAYSLYNSSVKLEKTEDLRGEGPAAAPRGGAGMGLERYTVVRKIGEGTYGAAYLVHLRDDPGHALVMYALAPPRARGVAGGGGARSPQQHQQPGEAAKAPEPGRGGGSRSGGRSWPAAPPPALPPVVDVPPRRREVTSLGPVLVRSCVLLDPGDTTLRGTAAGPGHRHRGHRRAGSPDRALASEEAGCPGG